MHCLYNYDGFHVGSSYNSLYKSNKKNRKYERKTTCCCTAVGEFHHATKEPTAPLLVGDRSRKSTHCVSCYEAVKENNKGGHDGDKYTQEEGHQPCAEIE